jgi:type I restriction enzyme, S subunit
MIKIDLELEKVAKLGSGGTPSKKYAEKYFNGNIPWIKSGELNQHIIKNFEESITESGLKNSSAKIVPKGSVLIAMIGATVGKSSLLEIDAATNQNVCSMIPNYKIIDSSYLHYYLIHSYNKIKALSAGGAQAIVSQKVLRKLSIPIIPLMEQRKLVKILDHSFELVLKGNKAINKVVNLKKSLYSKMVGMPADKQNLLPLSEIIIGKPQYGANAKAINYVEGCPWYVRITDIDNDGILIENKKMTLDLEDWGKYKLEKNDLLIARTGATVGKSYLYDPLDGLCAYAGYLIKFKINEDIIDPLIVECFLKSDYYHNWVKNKKRSVAQPNINAQIYSNLLVPIPDKPTQEKFKVAYKKIKLFEEKIKKQNAKIKKLYKVLLQKAFYGDLTADWRREHMEELLQEMEHQKKYLPN